MDWESFWIAQNWGSVPEWLGAIGTIGAVAYALGSSFSSRKQLQRERLAAARQRAEAALDRKRLREQLNQQDIKARRSAAEKVTMTLRPPKLWGTSQGKQMVEVKIEVHNGGGEPIKLVNTVARQLPEEEIQQKEGKKAATLPKSWRIIKGLGSEIAAHDYPVETYWRYEVQFTDSNDIRWVRDELGKLEELDLASARAVDFALY